MNNVDYKLFLKDLVFELVELTKDSSLYEDGNDFGAGYRASLYTALSMIESQAFVWGISKDDVGLEKFSADEWKAVGRAYSAITGK